MTKFTNSQVALVSGAFTVSSILGWETFLEVKDKNHYLEEKLKPEGTVSKLTTDTLQNTYSALCGMIVHTLSFGTIIAISRKMNLLT